MKKSVIFVMLIMMACGLKLFAGPDISYIKAGGNTYLGTKVKLGLFHMKIMTLDGKVLKIPNSKVDAYMNKKHLFERLPVICGDDDKKCLAMMEYITSRAGLRLYRYTSVYDEFDPLMLKVEKAKIHEDYYVFKDGEFYLRIEQRNAATALPFFGVNVID